MEEPEIHYPLRVVRCNVCHFIQLDHVVDPKILYQEDYPYESSMTRTGQAHFHLFAEQIVNSFGLTENDLAVDVGSNVGVLLEGFKKQSCRVLGVDPAKNIAAIAEHNGIPTIGEFFTPDVAESIRHTYGPASVITGSNVFAHVDDLDSFVTAVKNLLKDDGIFVIEAPYLVHLLEKLEYDTIYHEHLSYMSIKPLVRYFAAHGLCVFDVQEVDIHGGSIRIFVGNPAPHPVKDSVLTYLDQEEHNNLYDMDNLRAFGDRVADHREELVWLLKSLKREGKKIAGVSAPAKGMTLLNYCKIGTETLEFLTEKSLLKLGRLAPGNHLEVVTDEMLVTKDIDYALILAWNFKDEIMGNLPEFRAKGGKFIIPVPTPTIV